MEINNNIHIFAQKKNWMFVGEGLDNLVYTNSKKELVFRVPKKEDTQEAIKKEAVVLPRLAGNVKNIHIPIPTIFDSEEIWYASYPFVKGVCLDTVKDVARRQNAFEQLGVALAELHTQDVSLFSEITRIVPEKKYHIVQEKAVQLPKNVLNDEQRRYIQELFAAFFSFIKPQTIPLALVHGDISEEHIYYNEAQHVVSIIDWSDITMTDPAYEFYHLLRDVSAREQEFFIQAYNTTDPLFWKRAEYYMYLDTIEVLCLFVEKHNTEQIKQFIACVDQDSKNWKAM